MKVLTIHTGWYISYKDTAELNSNLSSAVARMGESAPGDEKLFHFTGNSGWIRKVPTKPDRIGSWNYELTIKLSCNLPYLIYTSTHCININIGEKIPCAQIMDDWADMILHKGDPNTILVADSTGKSLFAM